jgi:hypothetical protein
MAADRMEWITSLLLNYSKKNSIVCVKGLVDLNSSVSYDEQKLSLLPKVNTYQ